VSDRRCDGEPATGVRTAVGAGDVCLREEVDVFAVHWRESGIDASDFRLICRFHGGGTLFMTLSIYTLPRT
jgi:hypothetical protein